MSVAPDFLKPATQPSTEQINYKPTPYDKAVWMGNSSAVLTPRNCKQDIQIRGVELTAFYTCLYRILWSAYGLYSAGVFSLAGNIINSNNIRLVSSNYIHSPPRESLINPYYKVTFTRNLLQTWTHIHRIELLYTGWCMTHWTSTAMQRICTDGGDDGARVSQLCAYRCIIFQPATRYRR
jgi:hypothetical protein